MVNVTKNKNGKYDRECWWCVCVWAKALIELILENLAEEVIYELQFEY